MSDFLSDNSSLQLWAGLESTVNRVGEQFFDQLEWSGHAGRIGDLDLVSQLGIKTLRYPILWERVAPEEPGQYDWCWSDERLGRLRELGIRPIVGLVHHGSGPRYTDLLDPQFGEKLACYAAAVAERYPWLEAYTPVNEPLTTARFSGLYGHWYPHHRTNASFIRALVNECRAVGLAMRAIRQVNPQACLVQTEDMGKTFSTPMLAYQAEFENERRWLSFDLLMGRIKPGHYLWNYMLSQISQTELEWFQENPCPPDIFGINYYLSSERFLDEQVHLYPVHTHGGNGQHKYADVEAVRVRSGGLAGYHTLLREAWERYGRPLAVTEAHNGCTREEQLRWLALGWQSCQELREQGVDVRALTVWSFLGAYDWNRLVTEANGHYEPGVFDLRGSAPRPTALAGLVGQLATGQAPQHPTLDLPGWWERPERHLYGLVVKDGPTLPQPVPLNMKMAKAKVAGRQPVLISGLTGTLGQAFARLCELRGLPYCLLNRQELDISDPQSVSRVLKDWQPWAVVNAAGYVRVDLAEAEPVACLRANTLGPVNLARECARHGIKLLTFSSDLVFDGKSRQPYLEDSQVAPLNVYGRSKYEAEQQVLRLLPEALVVRTSAFFGPWDKYNFVTLTLQALQAGQPCYAAPDMLVSPTYVPDLVHAALDLLIDSEGGLWHLANQGEVSWFELASLAARLAGIDQSGLRASSSVDRPYQARRPQYRVLDSQRGRMLPKLEDALRRYLADCELLDWQAQSRSA